LLDLFFVVGTGRDDKCAIKEIKRETVGAQVVSSSDLGDSSVGCHDNDGGLIAFKSSVQEREALDVKHMDLIDEEYTRHDLSTTFLSPFSYFLVNLLSNFGFDFTDITSE
jgi:hypothetical protein